MSSDAHVLTCGRGSWSSRSPVMSHNRDPVPGFHASTDRGSAEPSASGLVAANSRSVTVSRAPGSHAGRWVRVSEPGHRGRCGVRVVGYGVFRTRDTCGARRSDLRNINIREWSAALEDGTMTGVRPESAIRRQPCRRYVTFVENGTRTACGGDGAALYRCRRLTATVYTGNAV